MHTAYYNEYSYHLDRMMEFKVYGHAGRPCLVFPAQSGRFYDFENFGMVGAVQDLLEQGRLQLFTCDSIDWETWAAFDRECRGRIERHEAYARYIVEELAPRILEINQWSNDGRRAGGILTTGCSLGALHAVNFMFRWPDLFNGTIGLSGIYSSKWYFGSYMDDLVYNNSTIDYLDQMPADHPYVEKYRHCDIVLCCDQGDWEQEAQQDTRRMQELLGYKNIPAWIDYWGGDAVHDWPWWRKQFPYFISRLC